MTKQKKDQTVNMIVVIGIVILLAILITAVYLITMEHYGAASVATSSVQQGYNKSGTNSSGYNKTGINSSGYNQSSPKPVT